MTHAEEIINRAGEEKVAVSMRLLACCYTLHWTVWGGVRAAACISPRWMPEISRAWLGEGEQTWRGWEGEGRGAAGLSSSKTCHIPPSGVPGDEGRAGGLRGRAFPDRSRHSEQYGGKKNIFKSAVESGPGLENTWSQGWLVLCNDSETHDWCVDWWRRSWPLR